MLGSVRATVRFLGYGRGAKVNDVIITILTNVYSTFRQICVRL